MRDVEWSNGFRRPCTIQISGPTGCGKTRFVRQILENRLIEPFPGRILCVNGKWQDNYEAIRSIYPHIELVVKEYADSAPSMKIPPPIHFFACGRWI